MSNRELELAVWLDGADGPASPLRMMGAGADGGIGGSGAANGVPFSQSQSERLSGRRVKPSQDGGPFDQFAQPPSCHAITQMMNSRRHIVLMPLSFLSPDAAIFAYAVVPWDRTRRILPPCRLPLTAARPRLADQRAPA